MMVDIREVKTYYINLDRDVERNKSMIDVFNNYSFKNYERVSGVIANDRVGCSLSHIKALEIAVKNNIYPYIILEDDVNIYNNKFIIDIPDDSDALYLGISSFGSNINIEKKAEKLVYIKNIDSIKHKVVNMVGRHAIVHTNKKYDIEAIKYNKLFIKNKNKYFAGDVAISELNNKKNVYCLNTPVFYQNDKKTIDDTKLSIYNINFKVV